MTPIVELTRRFYEAKLRRMGFAENAQRSPLGSSCWYRATDRTCAVLRANCTFVPAYYRGDRRLSTAQVIEMYQHLENEQRDYRRVA